MIPLVFWAVDKLLGLITDFAKPLLTLAVVVFAADYYGVIDVGALLTDLIPNPLDLLGLAAVVVL